MRITSRLVVGVAMALASVSFPMPALSAPSHSSHAPFVEGRVLVQPKAGLPDARFRGMLRRHDATSAGALAKRLGTHVVHVPAGDEERVAAALSRNPFVKFAEPDWHIPPVETPDDPLFSDAWHLSKTEAPNAWDLTKGSEVVVAVLDTGVNDTHEDLSAKVLAGWNVASDSDDTSDVHGHGTKTSGVAGAATDNATGVSSVGWQVQILPVRITDSSDGWATASDIANGLAWASEQGARIASLSFDVAGSSTVERAADQFRSDGGLVIAAAGNTGDDRGYEASDAHVMVAATNSSDGHPSWSSHGDYVDVSAPGVDIATTTRGGGYAGMSGTSASTPVVAGVVALMRSANAGLSGSQLESLLFEAVDDIGASGWDPYFGHGRVNAHAAVVAASEATSADTTPPTVEIDSPSDGATVADVVNVIVLADDDVGVAEVALHVDGAEFATETSEPYEFAWDSTSVGDGETTFTAVATDEAGNSTTSSKVSVQVSNDSTSDDDTTAPTVTIGSPDDGATVSGTLKIEAWATDDGSVTQIDIQVAGELLCSGGSPLSCTWNTRKTADGSHSISATAHDDADNTGSTAISVTVANSKDGDSTDDDGGNGGGWGKGGKPK